MKRKKSIFILILTMLICLSAGLCACTGTSNKNPYDVIQEAYGDDEFVISFNSEGLDNPLTDVSYSANNMPVLPIPTRVGYIFEGWYLDSDYTIPYIDGILYLYMRDVTMYAKWSPVSFEIDGTYDIEFQAAIVEGSVKKGALTDEYGGYADFSEAIIAEETYFEKSGGRLYLRIQYDSGTTIPFLTTVAMGVYSVGISSSMPTSVYIDNSIDSYNDQIKTIFIDITDFDYTQTLYFDVQTINWQYPGLEDDVRVETLTRYTIAFDITRVIGFSEIYANTDSALEEGYYLAKSYYSYPDGSSSMGASFNPVYSYIYSDGQGSYTLIKQNIPYIGLLLSSSIYFDPYYLNYFQRMMVFLPFQTAYKVDLSDFDPDEEYDYLPEAYNGGNYVMTATEFHAKDGKAYNIIDMGNDLKSSYLVTSAVTGYMEAATGMGTYSQVLTIDYDQLIRLSSCDYEPLDGDAYQYESEMQYYPGDMDDLNENNVTYQNVLENGISTPLINYFYSATSLAAADTTKTVYDSKITITPSAAANAQTVAQSRYTIADFSVNALVYGYDERESGENLYVDSMTVQNFGSSGWREWYQIKAGKSCKIGEQINLANLYAEKVNSADEFTDVIWTAYEINDGAIDYSASVSLATSTFNFSRDVAIVFEKSSGGNTYRTVVELVAYEEPEIRLVPTGDAPYNEDNSYMSGMTVSIPDVEYTWMGVSGNYIEKYYSGDQETANAVYFAYFTVDEGLYTMHYSGWSTSTVALSGDATILVYQLKNVYGENYFYTIEIDTSQKLTYLVEDDLGEGIGSGYLDLDADGERTGSLSFRPDTQDFTLSNAAELMSRKYYIQIGNNRSEMLPATYSIYSDVLEEYSVEISGDFEETIAQILEKINDANYAFVQIVYERGSDTITKTYAFNMFMTGGNSFSELLPYQTYFAGYDYSVPKYRLYSMNGDYIAEANLSIVCGTENVTIDRTDNYQFNFSFDDAGNYEFTYTFYLSSSLRYKKSITTEVKSPYSDVIITYITDQEHPFNDGTTSMTVTYSLAEDIYLLSKRQCATEQTDALYGWSLESNMDASGAYLSGYSIGDFVAEFNADSITLYAVWDPYITVTYRAEGQKDITRTVSLSSLYGGAYRVELMDYSEKAPANKYFAGWTGGFIGDVVYEITPLGYRLSMDEVEWDNPDFFVIEAVFLEIYTVKYDIDSSFSDDFYRNESVLEGYTVNAPLIKNNLKCKVEGYEFKGWYVQGDPNETLIDLETYKIYGDVTLVAVFGPKGE